MLKNPPQPKFHAMLEAVGNADWQLYTHSEAYLAPGGVFLSVGPQGSGVGYFLWKVYLQPGFLGGTKRKFK